MAKKTALSINFKRLVETHQDKVRNTCYRLVNNADDADDIAQEVFVQIYESLSSFRQEAELSTWIYRIAVNKSLDFIRKKKRKKRFAQIVSLFGFDEEKEDIADPLSIDPLKELENNERAQLLKGAVATLPENQKTVITLSRYEGFKNKEIADIMELSVAAVDGLLHRAKNNLHKQLAHYFEQN